ncbi:MAG: quinol monooxygenase YgiN [Cyclobacteriaceae bacterium]|jgi:quinol monooxygenase YgiN
MIIRIVRMDFIEHEIQAFLEIFNNAKTQIKAFEGCEYLSLNRDITNENVFYTISHWKSEAHLEKYRNSELFKRTWAMTKQLFNEKPYAYSLEKFIEL